MPILLLMLTVLSSPAFSREAAKGLPLEEAVSRAARVSGVRYELTFELSADKPDFLGTVGIFFAAAESAEPLTIDFEQGTVSALEVNGKTLDAAKAYNGYFVTIPGSALVASGENFVKITFSHPYGTTGAGLYRFTDPDDGRSYLYTDFEPYNANKLFPCFDQPDLKASYKPTVLAPEDWIVVTSNLESESIPVENNRRRWRFPESERFSTYIFSLHAGHYQVWNSNAGTIPLRLLARKSMAQFINPDEWFLVTRQGFSFFNSYFDVPYPFGKYDQLIVPDFNSGAMENVGAVTFSERFVQRGRSTWNENRDRADVILHEMAHMWFGNLVTMRWWDDLWLNESFASYMSALAGFSATRYKDAWEAFLLRRKQQAYWEDQLVTTHPIETPVPDTASAFANFDGITYGKGASTLKQAAHYLGADEFRDGIRLYFKRHAYQNAVRKDFMDALSSASGKNLDAWTKDWLQSSGVNTAEAAFSCVGGKISSLSLKQGSQAPPQLLRPHAANAALYKTDADGSLKKVTETRIEYSGSSFEIADLKGQPCPDLVYTNSADHDYVKLRLDPISLETAKRSLGKLGDPLDRAGIWMTLWDMVLDGEIPAGDYLDAVLSHLDTELAPDGSLQLLEKLLATINGKGSNSHSALLYLSGEDESSKSRRAAAVARVESFLWERLVKSPKDSEQQSMLFDAYLKTAESPEGLTKIESILDGSESLNGWKIDQDRRWTAVHRLNQFAAKGSKERADAESSKDRSHRGRLEAVRALASRPDAETKELWLKKALDAKTTAPFSEIKAAVQSLFPPEQAEHRRRFAKTFYAELPALSAARPPEFMKVFTPNLVPADCDEAASAPLGEFIEKNPGLGPVVLKALKVAKQENERCIKARALAARSLR